MLHSCSIEGCSTLVFGHGPCVEHDNPRVPLAEQLLAGAVERSRQSEPAGSDDVGESAKRITSAN